MIVDSHVGPCDAHRMLRSSVGIGPKGKDGHSISVSVVQGDPYGCYRLQFKDSVTNQVLATTPNLDPGSRVYLCTKEFTSDTVTYSALITQFTAEQVGSIRDVRVGDIVMFKSSYGDGIRSFGVGVVNTVAPNGTVTFTPHILVGPGTLKESLEAYVLQQVTHQVNQKAGEARTAQDKHIDDKIDLAVRRQDALINEYIELLGRQEKANSDKINQEIEDSKRQITKFTKGVYFGLTSDGHFVAYIPEGWEDLIFDTGKDYLLDTYGRLILRMNVNGSRHDFVDQTPEVVRPYSDAELEQKVYNIMQTLYSTMNP